MRGVNKSELRLAFLINEGLCYGCTQDQYLKEAQEIHGSKYIYDKTVYTKAHVKVTITCPTHGDFTMNARCHIKPQCCGCPDCAGNSRKTTEQFIREAK